MTRFLKLTRVSFVVGTLGVAVSIGSVAHAGSLRGQGGHKASGSAKVSGSSVRFSSSFRFDGGPDVYVAVSRPGKKIKLLGKLRKNSGSQSYRLPKGVKKTDVSRILLWCKRYGVTLGSASAK